MKIPGLGALLLNLGAITALTSIWSALPEPAKGPYHLALTGMFVAFALGVGLAVISLCCQFVRDAADSKLFPSRRYVHPKRHTGLSAKIEPYVRPELAMWIVVAFGLLVLWALIRASAPLTLSPLLRALGGLAGIAFVMYLVARGMAGEAWSRFLALGVIGASGLAMLLFGLGLIATMATWTTIQLGQSEPPAASSASGPRGGNVTLHVAGCGNSGRAPCPLSPPAQPQPQPRVGGGTNVHFDIHLNRAAPPPSCPPPQVVERVIERRCPRPPRQRPRPLS